MADNEILANFWSNILTDPRVDGFENIDGSTRKRIYTSANSLEGLEELRQSLVDQSGLQPNDFELLFTGARGDLTQS